MNKAKHCKWEGSYKTKDGLYEVEFRADGHSWYRKQTYFEPEESEIECDECKILKVTNLKDDSEVTLPEELQEKCNDIHLRTIAELEKENAELKEDVILAFQKGAEFGLKQHSHDYLVKTKNLKKEFEKQIACLQKQTEKMKCCTNCRHSRTEYEHCKTNKHEKWELAD